MTPSCAERAAFVHDEGSIFVSSQPSYPQITQFDADEEGKSGRQLKMATDGA
jgi:hypothetical protein